jgi:hypothetical protein
MDIASVIIIVVAIVILIGCLYYQIKKNGLKGTAIELIVYAERMLGSGKVEEKMNYVIDKFIAYLPMPFRLLLTREMVKNFIQEVFDEIKDVLEYQSAGGQE